MSEESREQRYRRLIDDEQSAFEHANKMSKSAGLARREAAAREWFAASARLLKEYCRSYSDPGDSGPFQQFPGRAIARMAGLAEDLAAGRHHPAISDVKAAGGRPGRFWFERRDIATALQYITYARNGAVPDKAWIKTVCKAFSVAKWTVRDWEKDSEDILRDMRPIPPSQFPEALYEAGARYNFNRPAQLRNVATALQYIDHAEIGSIKDENPRATVCEAFSVDLAIVDEWQGRREEILRGAKKIQPNKFPGALKEAGDSYIYNQPTTREGG